MFLRFCRIYIILFTIDVITAIPQDKSLAVLSKLQNIKSKNPLIFILKPKDGNHHALRMTEKQGSVTKKAKVEVIEIDKNHSKFFIRKIIRGATENEDEPKKNDPTDIVKTIKQALKERNLKRHIKTEESINFLIKMLQIPNSPVVRDLKEKFRDLEKAITKKALRNGCSVIDSDSCEEKPRDKKYRQKTNREVYEYFKENLLNRAEKDRPENKKKRIKIKLIIDHKTKEESDDCNPVSDECGGQGLTGSTRLGRHALN